MKNRVNSGQCVVGSIRGRVLRTALYPVFILFTILNSQFSILNSLWAQQTTTVSNDFWVAWVESADVNSATQQRTLALKAMGDTSCNVTVTNPITGWSTTDWLDSGSVLTIHVPDYAAPGGAGVTAAGRAFHVTSTACIQLMASYIQPSSSGVAGVLPTDALRKSYMVLDYPTDTGNYYSMSGAALAFVAIADSTLISMRLPCAVQGSAVAVGDTLHVMLMAGQSHVIVNHTPGGSFTGMEVTANRRFAMFEGNRYAEVPNNNTVGDYVFEQAVPVEMWGSEYALVATRGRNTGDRIRVVASNDCEVTVSNGNSYTLAAGGSVEFTLPPYNYLRLSAAEPVCVGLFMTSPAPGGEHGDATMVLLPPLDAGVRYAAVAPFPYEDLTEFYLSIVTRIENVAGVELDGQGVPFQLIDSEYCYSRMLLDTAPHYLRGRTGDFVAWAYGCGDANAYAYPVCRAIIPYDYDTVDVFDWICPGEVYDDYGVYLPQEATLEVGTMTFRSKVDTNYYILHLTVMSTVASVADDSISYGDTLHWGGLEITEPGLYTAVFSAANGCDSTVQLTIVYRYDTIHLFDTVCQRQPYSGYGFDVSNIRTNMHGELTLHRDTIEDGVPHRYLLHLEVLPTPHTTLTMRIVVGDTLFFADTAITHQGEYHFRYTAANGCDSTVMLTVVYEAVAITASETGVCPGAEVTITATGTHTYIWTSEPYDAELDAQQGMNPITVHPMQTTVYGLLDELDSVVASVRVGTDTPPALKVVANRDVLDFDQPVLVLTDGSDGRHSTEWLFDDGYRYSGETVSRRYFHPLPDSVVVTMNSCNNWGCCADTIISIPMRVNSVWFPNIFTPGRDNNNLFWCHTSFDVEAFELVIFNRWGLMVWSTSDVKQGWDGRSNDGVVCSQGAYSYRYYLRSTAGDVRTGYGTVTLLR